MQVLLTSFLDQGRLCAKTASKWWRLWTWPRKDHTSVLCVKLGRTFIEWAIYKKCFSKTTTRTVPSTIICHCAIFINTRSASRILTFHAIEQRAGLVYLSVFAFSLSQDLTSVLSVVITVQVVFVVIFNIFSVFVFLFTLWGRCI